MTASSGYVAISRRSLDLEDYIDLARRHIAWIAGPTFAGLVISIVVAFLLPNTYVSQAEMQITPSQISSNIVASTVNQELNERISQMEQEILSRTSLSTIITDPRLDLYKSDRATKPLEDVIEAMRTKDIRIGIVAVPGSDRRTSAFTISFQYSDPHKAQQVVQTLMTKFNALNETTQHDTQTLISSYVGDELTQAKAQLGRVDDELTKFRVDHPGEMPEEEQLNITELNSLQQQLGTANDSLNRLAQSKVQYDNQLDTLKERQQLLTMFDKDDLATQPPAVRQQNERLVQLNRDITNGEASLALLKQNFTSKYPDIRDLERRLTVVRKERDDLQKKQDEEEAKPKETQQPKKSPATNFQQAQAASTLDGQIKATNAQMQVIEMQRNNLEKERDVYSKKMAEYQQRLANTSALEAKYAELQRTQKLAAEQYQAYQAKEQMAEQSSQIIQRRAGEQLNTLDPPSLPTQPSKPNRWLVVGAGIGISFILGLALAGVQEARDTSLKNLKDVRAYTNLPVLSSIPLLENTMLVRRKRRLAYLAWSGGVILGMLAITASLYYHYTPS